MRTTFAAIVPMTLLAIAMATPAAAELKLAAISEAKIMQPQLAAIQQKMEGEFKKREDELRAEGKKLEDDVNRFRREADTMSPQQRTTAQNDLNTRKTNFDIKQRTYSEQAQARQNELQRDALIRVNEAIKAVVAEKGLDLVVNNPAFANDSLDITPDVLKKLEAMGEKPAADAKKKKK